MLKGYCIIVRFLHNPFEFCIRDLADKEPAANIKGDLMIRKI
jgi:hypothetical protein